MLELGDVLSVSEEEGLSGVVRAHLVLLFEGGLDEAELDEAAVQVEEHHDGSKGDPQGVVSDAAAGSALQGST